MTAEQRAVFQTHYQAGRAAFECGQYRQSIAYLEQACQAANRRSRAGGEAQLWLVHAYQAAERWEAALALCQELQHHPHPSISRQAKDVLYILQAPRLQRPPDWLTQIPDLAALDESATFNRYVSTQPMPAPESGLSLEQFPPPAETTANHGAFVGVAIALAALVLGGFWWLG